MRYQAALLPDWIRALGFKANWRKDKDRLGKDEAEHDRNRRDESRNSPEPFSRSALLNLPSTTPSSLRL